MFSMVKTTQLTVIGASCEEEPPMAVGAAAALEEEAIIFAFGAITTVKSLKKD